MITNSLTKPVLLGFAKMSTDQVIIDIISSMFDEVEITSSTNLRTELHLSLFDLANLMVAIEEALSVTFYNEPVDEWFTVEDIIDFVNKS